MSYARFGADSDVYVFATTRTRGEERDGGIVGIVCMGCDPGFFTAYAGILDHLAEHEDRGDRVPVHCTNRLIMEQSVSDNVAEAWDKLYEVEDA